MLANQMCRCSVLASQCMQCTGTQWPVVGRSCSRRASASDSTSVVEDRPSTHSDACSVRHLSAGGRTRWNLHGRTPPPETSGFQNAGSGCIPGHVYVGCRKYYCRRGSFRSQNCDGRGSFRPRKPTALGTRQVPHAHTARTYKVAMLRRRRTCCCSRPHIVRSGGLRKLWVGAWKPDAHAGISTARVLTRSKATHDKASVQVCGSRTLSGHRHVTWAPAPSELMCVKRQHNE